MKAPWSAKHDEEDHQSLVAAMKTLNIADRYRGGARVVRHQECAACCFGRGSEGRGKPRDEPDMTNMAPGRKMYHTKDQRETIERNLRRLKREKGSPKDIAMYEAALVENDPQDRIPRRRPPELLDGPTHRTAPSESASGSWGSVRPGVFPALSIPSDMTSGIASLRGAVPDGAWSPTAPEGRLSPVVTGRHDALEPALAPWPRSGLSSLPDIP